VTDTRQRKITQADIDNRFTYHPPTDPAVRERHEQARACARTAAEFLVDLLPPGRETSLAITKLEEVLFWANAAIARDGAGDALNAPTSAP
jgi:hypothetical protein